MLIKNYTSGMTLRVLGGEEHDTDAGPLLGIFDHDYVEGVDVEARPPTLTCNTAAVERLQLRKGARVTVSGVAYRVRRHEPDGTGLSRLILET